MKKILLALATFLAASLALAGCTASAEATVHPSTEAVIIDVRTPEEYASGHLEGAHLLDLNSGEFAATFTSLDPEAEYYVYCRSGNRSAQAISMMESEGFTNVTNLGSVGDASKATGIEIVK